MKLTTRRTVRKWFLDAPSGTAYALYAAAVGVTALGVFADAAVVTVAGFGAGMALFVLRDSCRFDACPRCNSSVNAMKSRFCATCGERLDDIEAAPPIDERVDERFRPVGLEELERREPPERAPAPVTDGGESDEHEEAR